MKKNPYARMLPAHIQTYSIQPGPVRWTTELF